MDTDMVSPEERPGVLNRLCKKCDRERSLPSSMVVTYASLQVPPTLPEAGGGSGDVYRGEYNGRPAAVKVMRIYGSNDRESFPQCLYSISCSPW
jgi:hypothetical protein